MTKDFKTWFSFISLLDLYPWWAKLIMLACVVGFFSVFFFAPKKRPPSNVVVEPELDISISGSNLKLTNEGKIDIIDVKLIDIVGIHFNIATKKIGTTHVESPHRVMFPKIKPGLSAKYPIKNMAIQLGKKASPNEFEAYCFFIRFRRPSDRRSYVRPVKVVRVVENEKEMFFPLEPMKDAIMASSSSEMFFDILREKLDKICRDRFGQHL